MINISSTIQCVVCVKRADSNQREHKSTDNSDNQDESNPPLCPLQLTMLCSLLHVVDPREQKEIFNLYLLKKLYLLINSAF